MLQTALIFFGLSISLLVRYTLFRKNPTSINKILQLICMVALPVGIYFTITNATRLVEHSKRSKFPHTIGTVIKSEIVGSEKAYRPLIVYEYAIDSETYTDSTSMHSPMFGNKRKQYDVAKVTSEEYPVGKQIQVIYNPDNPADNELHIALRWNVYGQLGFGMTFLILSFFGLLLPKKKSWI